MSEPAARGAPAVTDDRIATPLLLALLDGTTFANAMRPSGKPSRVRLPDDSEARSARVGAHLRGAPSTLTFHAEGRELWRKHVDAVALAAFCPAADGHVVGWGSTWTPPIMVNADWWIPCMPCAPSPSAPAQPDWRRACSSRAHAAGEAGTYS